MDSIRQNDIKFEKSGQVWVRTPDTVRTARKAAKSGETRAPCQEIWGSYEYEIQGVSRDDSFTFFLTPSQGQSHMRLGTIEATAKLGTAGTLSGTWQSSVGTAGVFNAQRAEPTPTPEPAKNKVFLVHGHDEGTKEKVARFLEKLGLDVIILHERVSQGMTVIEKFEEYAKQAAFAVILFTPDDIGHPLGQDDRKHPRARQNVVLEMGYFVGTLRRSRVCVLYKGGVELPSDILGVVYNLIDDAEGWKLTLARELKAAGYELDLNKISA